MKSFLIRPALFPAARAWTRLLQTDRTDLGAFSMILRGTLFVPVMAVLVALLRVRLILFGPLEIEAFTSRELRFGCALPDLIQMYLALFGVWEPDITAFIESRLKQGDAFVDVGANVGWLSLVAARQVGEMGRVIAIEPSPTIHAALLANIRRNNAVARVRAVQAAASDEPSELAICPGPAWNIGRSSASPARGVHEEVFVNAAPLGDLVAPEEVTHARLIKIDVEGGETRVLRGLIGLLPAMRNDVEIVVELSPQWWEDPGLTPEDVLQPFVEAGFRAYEMTNNYWPWRYLWPGRIQRPQRITRRLGQRVRRLDLVFSRIDAAAL